MKYTEQQNKIFHAIVETESHVIVNAGAGTGKTSTIVEAANRIARLWFCRNPERRCANQSKWSQNPPYHSGIIGQGLLYCSFVQTHFSHQGFFG